MVSLFVWLFGCLFFCFVLVFFRFSISMISFFLVFCVFYFFFFFQEGKSSCFFLNFFFFEQISNLYIYFLFFFLIFFFEQISNFNRERFALADFEKTRVLGVGSFASVHLAKCLKNNK